ncbi:MAG TPA: hypothetical protein VF264_05110 [Rhodanobacteraceae bacterium]
MNEHLREINRSLHALDDAHRLGRIGRDDYRARRRHLLGTLRDSDGITARNTLAAKTVPAGRAQAHVPSRASDAAAMKVMFPRRRWFDWRRWFSGRR